MNGYIVDDEKVKENEEFNHIMAQELMLSSKRLVKLMEISKIVNSIFDDEENNLTEEQITTLTKLYNACYEAKKIEADHGAKILEQTLR